MSSEDDGSDSSAQNGLNPMETIVGASSALMGGSIALLAPKYQAPVAGASAGLVGAYLAFRGISDVRE